MRTALYYPHTEIQSEGLIRSALLTWDQLEFIVPSRDFKPDYQRSDMAEAIELIGSPVVPTAADRQEVHVQLTELIARGVPEPFRYGGGGGREHYEMWQQKLMAKTWQLLREHDVVGDLLENADYPATQGGGLTIMAMLADVMAGETRARITDRGLAYATLANVANIPGRKAGGDEDLSEIIPLTFKSLALEHVGLRRLIDFRRREEQGNGHDYRTLRHNYVDRLSKHLTAAAKYPVGSRDRMELDRVFEQDMEDDLRDLKQELGLAKTDVILSKDTVAFVLAGATVVSGALAGHLSIPEAMSAGGAPATIGGILNVMSKFGSKRREVLRKHPMAYLYEVG
jgi:hypothetical protein